MLRTLLRKASSGADAEDRAERWLHQQGLSTLARNYRCRQGELDLVMLDGDSLVFVEVRLRNNRHYGGALASVDQHKQRRLIQAARHFIAAHRAHQHRPCRFDVVGQEPDRQGSIQFQWISNAFYGE